MTTTGRAASTAPGTSRALPRLRAALFEDYPEIARLKSSNGLGSLPTDDWYALCVNNPLRRRLGDGPTGWVLENETGRLVGSLASFPSLYAYRGGELIAANGHAWVVDPEYRGVALWLMDEYFSQEGIDLFINTTVNAHAEGPFGTFGSERVPVGDWKTAAYWVTGSVGFTAAALRLKGVPLPGLLAHPAAAALRLKDAFRAWPSPAATASVVVDEARGFDARFDGFWSELLRGNPDKLLGVRDRATLSWYFAGPLRAGRVWVLTASQAGLLRAYAVLKRQDSSRTGLRRLRLVDFQTLEPDPDLLRGLLRIALRRCAAEGIHALEHVGMGLSKMRDLDESAPYRRSLPSWPFYYKASSPALANDLRNPEVWDPSGFDGDAGIQ